MLTLFFGHCKPLTKESDLYLKAQALTFTEVQQNTVSSCRGQPLSARDVTFKIIVQWHSSADSAVSESFIPVGAVKPELNALLYMSELQEWVTRTKLFEIIQDVGNKECSASISGWCTKPNQYAQKQNNKMLSWSVVARVCYSAEKSRGNKKKKRRKEKQWQLQIASVSATSMKGLWELKSGSKGTQGAFKARARPSAPNLLLLIWAAVF